MPVTVLGKTYRRTNQFLLNPVFTPPNKKYEILIDYNRYDPEKNQRKKIFRFKVVLIPQKSIKTHRGASGNISNIKRYK